MNILAIESSAMVASVAVSKDGIILAEAMLNNKKTHSQTLLPMISTLLQNSGIKPLDLDYIAVSTGPGSYTGLRIGVATAKGLSAVGRLSEEKKEIPCVPVSSLLALSYNFSYINDSYICPVMDARRDRLYCALYKFERVGENTFSKAVLEGGVKEKGELLEKLKEIVKSSSEKKIIFTGDGTEIIKSFIKENDTSFNCAFVPEHLKNARGASLAAAALEMIEKNIIVHGEALMPEYLTSSQAERERFRDMKSEDVEYVARIEEESISSPWSVNAFNDALKNKNAYYLVCESGGALKGYAGMWMSADEAEITNVAVREDSRRGGVGSGLIKALIDKCKEAGIKLLFLEVRTSNEAAIGLYKKSGFQTAGKRKDFYKNPTEDAIIMRLEV